MSGNAVVLAHREKHEIRDHQDIFQASLCPTVTFSQFIGAATNATGGKGVPKGV